MFPIFFPSCVYGIGWQVRTQRQTGTLPPFGPTTGPTMPPPGPGQLPPIGPPKRKVP